MRGANSFLLPVIVELFAELVLTPNIAFVNDHIFYCPFTELRSVATRDQACFFAWMVTFLFRASALFHAKRFEEESGEFLHALKAFERAQRHGRKLHSTMDGQVRIVVLGSGFAYEKFSGSKFLYRL